MSRHVHTKCTESYWKHLFKFLLNMAAGYFFVCVFTLCNSAAVSISWLSPRSQLWNQFLLGWITNVLRVPVLVQRKKKKNSFTPVSLHNDEMLFRNNIKAREIYKEKCSYELHVQGCMCVLGGVDWWFWDFALGVFTSEIFTWKLPNWLPTLHEQLLCLTMIINQKRFLCCNLTDKKPPKTNRRQTWFWVCVYQFCFWSPPALHIVAFFPF